jgi:hypothetical protein
MKAGILVPPKPEEPDNCCMSGCVNCVWDRYRDEMEEWVSLSLEAERRLQAQRGQGPVDVLSGASAVKGMEGPKGPAVVDSKSDATDVNRTGSMDEDGGGSDANWPPGQLNIAKDFWDDGLYQNVPVGIREFMKTEKKLKEKHEKEGSVGG